MVWLRSIIYYLRGIILCLYAPTLDFSPVFDYHLRLDVGGASLTG
jgi:hypothetical protein